MSREIGKQAEDAAAAYLTSLGFQVLARNYAIRGAEVDIIARDGDFIVFVEVKARSRGDHGAPREAVTREKRRRIGQGALRWLQETGLAEANIRFDIVECLPQGMALLRGAYDFTDFSSI